jgi:hypothetical protein
MRREYKLPRRSFVKDGIQPRPNREPFRPAPAANAVNGGKAQNLKKRRGRIVWLGDKAPEKVIHPLHQKSVAARDALDISLRDIPVAKVAIDSAPRFRPSEKSVFALRYRRTVHSQYHAFQLRPPVHFKCVSSQNEQDSGQSIGLPDCPCYNVRAIGLS